MSAPGNEYGNPLTTKHGVEKIPAMIPSCYHQLTFTLALQATALEAA